MAGTVPGGVLNAVGTALIPETMARFQAPAMAEKARREQQVAGIQAGRLLGGLGAEVGTPQTKSFEVNGRTVGQDSPSTVAPLFSPTKSNALFSQAFPELGRANMAQQIQERMNPQGFTGKLGEGDVAFVNGKQVAAGPAKATTTKLPAEVELALFLTGGNEAAARQMLTERQNQTQADAGLNPIYGRDAQGNVVVMQPTKAGNLVRSTIPEGVIPTAPGEMAYEKAVGATGGRADAERAAAAPGVIATAQEALRNLRDLKNHPSLSSALGPIQGRLPAVYGEQADVVSRMEQIQGRAFLQAFDTLKGGGQITETEGAKATAAIARLNRAQEPKDYKAALTELETIIETGIERARRGVKAAPQTETPSAVDMGSPGITPIAENDPLGIRSR